MNLSRQAWFGPKGAAESLEAYLWGLGITNAEPAQWYFLANAIPSGGTVDPVSGSRMLPEGTASQLQAAGLLPGAIFNKSCQFQGGAYYQEADYAYAIPTKYTLFVFFKTAAAGPQALCGMMDTNAGDGSRAGLLLNAAGELVGGQDTASTATPFYSVTGSTALNDGAPHMAAMTFDSTPNLVTVYQDGTSIGTVTPGSLGIPGDTTVPVIAWGTFGYAGRATVYTYTGYMQSFLFWPGTVMTAAQIAETYAKAGL